MEDRGKNACIAQLMDWNEKEKKKAKQATEIVAVKTSAANSATANNGADVKAVNGVRIALFDFSVENFFRDMDTIVRLWARRRRCCYRPDGDSKNVFFSHFLKLTAKSVETDHARNRSRLFLCGSVTEENSNLVINTPVSNAPFLWKKPPEKGRCAESFRDLLSKTNPYKNTPNQVAETSNFDSQTLAIDGGENVDLLESGSEEALYSMKQPKRPKLKSGSKKKPKESVSVDCRDDDVPPITPEADNEKSDFGNIPETFPPKMAALHKVRWNMNKGSERWLCFGGACGLVRCQEIVYSDIDKKWALKK